MPAPVQIFDSRGNAMAAPRAPGAQIYESTQDNGLRLDRPRLDADLMRLMSRHKHQMLLSDSRYISTWSMVNGALEQKADYVSSGGWLPHFTGTDVAYGDEVTPILHAALGILDARGVSYDWETDWRIAGRTLDVDGDFAIAHFLTESGFPQMQMIEAHRIGCRNGERVVESGPYKGLKILNGIIYNPLARPVAIRYLADDPAQDRDISLRDCDYVSRPIWFSDGRPLPSLAYSVLDWYDMKTARGFEKQAQEANSAIAVVESNDTGLARQGFANGIPGVSTDTTSTTTPKTELLAGGLIRYIKHGGGSISSHFSPRPSDGWRAFDAIIQAAAFYGMKWRVEMFDLSKLSGAPTRGFQDNINTSIHSQWGTLTPPAKRVVLRTVSALVARGDIPRHAEWDQWAFPQPVDFTVDANKDSQTDRENIRAGLTTTPAAMRRTGYSSPDRVLIEQARYLQRKKEIAKQFALDPSELGTLAKPGEAAANQPPPTQSSPA